MTLLQSPTHDSQDRRLVVVDETRHALATEYVVSEDPNQPADTHLYRPVGGVVLQNDGVQYHWMLAGLEYELRYDGTGWHTTCRTWPDDGHVYRLADLSGRYVDWLPLLAGGYGYTPFALNHTRVYVLLPATDGVWILTQLAEEDTAP